MRGPTVHSLTDSLAQPACTIVYIECNPAPGGSPFELSLGLRSKLPSPICFPSPQSLCVCWFLVFWSWVASSRLSMIVIGECSVHIILSETPDQSFHYSCFSALQHCHL